MQEGKTRKVKNSTFQITIETFNRQMQFIKIRKIVHTRSINTILTFVRTGIFTDG